MPLKVNSIFLVKHIPFIYKKVDYVFKPGYIIF